jgi:hypothetical protein
LVSSGFAALPPSGNDARTNKRENNDNKAFFILLLTPFNFYKKNVG